MNNKKTTIDKNQTLSSETTVYVGVPYREFYKIDNLSALSNTKKITFDYSDANSPDKCKAYPEMKEMLKNKDFETILDKIYENEVSLYKSDPLYFQGIRFIGDFSTPIKTAYAQVSGEAMLYIVDSLDKFSGKFQDESGWGVEDWKKLI